LIAFSAPMRRQAAHFLSLPAVANARARVRSRLRAGTLRGHPIAAARDRRIDVGVRTAHDRHLARRRAVRRRRRRKIVVDIVGRDYVQRSLDVLALEGRLVHLATQGADKHATLDMSTLLKRRATIIGSALRHRTNDQKGEIAAGLLEHVWPKLPARAEIAPLVDSVHPLKDAARVHEYFDSGAHIGKIVLTP